MTSELFTTILGALLTILVAVISAYVVPFIKSKISQNDMATLLYFISLTVKAAEQLFPLIKWEEKKAYVVERVNSFLNKTLRITLTEAEIDGLIEGIVKDIKRERDIEVAFPEKDYTGDDIK